MFDANDWIYQTWAYDRHDVGTTPGFNGDTAKALQSVKAKTLILLGTKDLLNPEWEPQDASRNIPDVTGVAVVPCTSAIRALLAFSIGHHLAHNFPVKCTCCHFAQAIGIPSDPRITFPSLLKIRTSTLGLCALSTGRPAMASLAGRPHQPPRTPLHPSPPASASPPNPGPARRAVVAPSLAISSIGAFRTPAVGACG